MNQMSVERTSNDVWSMFSKDEFIELYDPVIKGVTAYSGVMCDGYTAMSAEWLAFLNRRLHIDLSLAATLARCDTPQECAQEWSNFFTTATNEYSAEFERLSEMMTATSQEVMSSWRDGQERNSREGQARDSKSAGATRRSK
jgi:hypothetical protein